MTGFAVIPWIAAADPTAVCAAAGETNPGERMFDGENLWIYGATQAAATAALTAHPPIIVPPNVVAAKATLDQLDPMLPRAVEDLITALGTPIANLPPVMQARLAAKQAARAIVQAAK